MTFTMIAQETSDPLEFFFNSYNYEKVELSCSKPRMSRSMDERVDYCLNKGCNCKHNQRRTATLKRRIIASYVTVHLQCDACGRSLSGSLTRNNHFNWQDYPAWDDSLQDRHQQARNEYQESRRAEYQDRTEQEFQAHDLRRMEYAEWCRTSPEWRSLSNLVIRRGNGYCESCFLNPSVCVHHLTYEFGKLPPAWHLKAVCSDCHDRLHDAEDEWCGSGMAR